MPHRMKGSTYVELEVIATTTRDDVADFLDDSTVGATLREFVRTNGTWRLEYELPGRGQYLCNGRNGEYLRLRRDASNTPISMLVTATGLDDDTNLERIVTPVPAPQPKMQRVTVTTGAMLPASARTFTIAWPTPFADDRYAYFLSVTGPVALLGAVSVQFLDGTVTPEGVHVATKAGLAITGSGVALNVHGYGLLA